MNSPEQQEMPSEKPALEEIKPAEETITANVNHGEPVLPEGQPVEQQPVQTPVGRDEETDGGYNATDEEVQALLPPPTHGLLRRILTYIFDPETRHGRFMRKFTRGLALVVALFALGLLTGYLLLYRPTHQALESTRAELVAVRQQADEAEQQALRVGAELGAVTTRVGEVQAVLQSRDTRIQLLIFENHITEARLALVNKDGPVTQQVLLKARDTLQPILPALREADRDLADSLDMRLNLAINELGRDPRAAQSDLDLISSTLEQLDKKMGN